METLAFPKSEKSDLKHFQTEFGYFTADGSEYVITRPDTPRPWVNVICPGDYGIVASQSGTGYSWRTHASLNRITRWNQDLVCDEWGKFVYIRDEETGEFWSAAWKPVCRKPDFYECRHGFGYTRFIAKNRDIQAELTLFVPPGEPLEIWDLKLTNLSGRKRKLSLWTYFEWNLGEGPDSHREFHKTFIETEPDIAKAVITAEKRIWTIVNKKGQHWNRTWEYTAWHASSLPATDISGSKDAFIGANGSFQSPRALSAGKFLSKTTGKWDDGVASICNQVSLEAGQSQRAVWTLGAAQSKKEALSLAKKYQDPAQVAQAWDAMGKFWKRYLETSDVSTPDRAFNLLGGRWLKYQSISGRIWGRTGYYQAGGAFGYRDQLQDSQVFLHIEPERTKNQILLHARHQFPDGTVLHWWHPITEQGPKSRFSDDLLWLPFLTANYLKETGDFSILKEKEPYLLMPGQPAKTKPAVGTLFDHCLRAIQRSFDRRSKRGLPLVGEGDWNDGLSTTGWFDKGETVWVAQFLYGILNDFCYIIPKAIQAKALPASEAKRIAAFKKEAAKLYKAVNGPGWDGKWYWAASTDDGTLIGSDKVKEGKIHLNAQTWAVMNRMVPENRMGSVLKSVETMLYRDYGPLVLWPAYQTPDERIGYLTRYAPGVRENGGLYTHAGTWAIQMECFLKRNAKAWDLFKKFCPIDRGMDPQKYVCEPYVTPGNVDGPDSPLYGRGGWTWYTGSSAWLYRIMMEWIAGVRPEWDGLKIDPCVPEDWNDFRVKRLYRGTVYDIHFKRDKKLARNAAEATQDGRRLEGVCIRPQASARKGGGEVQISVAFN